MMCILSKEIENKDGAPSRGCDDILTRMPYKVYDYQVRDPARIGTL